MNKKLALFGALTMTGALFMASCGGGDDSEGKEKQKVVKKTDEDETNDSIPETDGGKIDHRLPTPNMFFEVIKKIGGQADMELVNSVDNAEKYETSASKAMNFGVYFSDLAYMMNYGQNAETVQYFTTLEAIAKELSISAIFSAEIMEKFGDNGDNSDSLYTYSTEIYDNAYNYLEEENKGDVLSLMLVGGWVESMHIVTNLVGDFSDNNELIDEIAAQKDVLESILEHVSVSAESNPSLEPWLEDLGELITIYYDNIQNAESSSQRDESGKIILGGGDKVVLNKESFGTIVEKISEMRETIVNGQ